ncbi:hypothetical protein [Nostoc sp. ChiQUE01b]|uniref:hypothetical protein n=1 Tax=Nostoc sp. ChiQUE01b TaxID=3075376 RepID=UPI002AD32177|nr:hypothetical protein [Nostoc sp. ChiQUE01b]MDZ8238729.1 hypothetical protein [Nostoc sp. ChiQUE01a]MDZ8263573.1 hypothetical protein [Nostoc sp. ChiQUE01b]
MLNTKEYFNQFDVTFAVEELDNEAAATIQGGYDLIVYDGYNGTGEVLGEFNFGKAVLGAGNNRISSVKINAGRWKFSDWYYYSGQFEEFTNTGTINLDSLDNRTSSIQRF